MGATLFNLLRGRVIAFLPRARPSAPILGAALALVCLLSGPATARPSGAGPSAAERGWQITDEAAGLIRSARRAETPARALAQLDQAENMLAEVVAAPANTALLRRACFDRAVAQSEGGRFQAVIDDFQRDCAGLDPLPAYLLAALGDAWAGQREPERALELYANALALADADDAPHAGRIFALVDLDRSDEAERILTERLDQGRSLSPVDDQLRRVLVRAWSGWSDEAAERIAELRAEDPQHFELMRFAGRIAHLRDRPLEALAALDLALAAAPGHAGVTLDRIAPLDRLGRWAEAEAALAALREQAGDAWLPLLRVEEERRSARAATLGIRLRGARGGVRQIADGEVRSEVILASPVSRHGWQGYLAHRRAYADFRGRALEDEREALGLRWHHDRLRLRAELDRPRDRFVDETGYTLSADWRPVDSWSFGADWASRAFDLPLRARESGVSGDRLALAARFSPAAAWWLRAAASQTDFSDGNRRTDFALSGHLQRPLSHRWGFSLTPAAFWGRSRRDDVAYFSPRHDSSIELAGELRHRISARLAHRHWQMLQGFVGRYDQAGFAAGSIGGLAYRYQIDFEPGRSAWLRFGRDRRLYDGRHEYSSFLEFGMDLAW